ncbi:oxidoreductase domain protein [candidate division TM7 genomosp. GTL1]|nr:oxidoreductase domain protein [candidate division TM7 genomosp. GTL1]
MLKLGASGGGGHLLDSHWPFAEQAGFRMVAVYDLKPDHVKTELKGRRLSGEEITWVTSMRELLRQDLDAVLITSPDKEHPAQLAAAIEAGVSVLVDKPAAIDATGLRTVRNAIAHRGSRVVVSSCHPRRFDPPYQALRKRLNRLIARYGALVHIEMDFSYPTPRKAWKATRSLLLDHFIHELDFMRWLLDEPLIGAKRLQDTFDHYCVSGTIGIDSPVTFTCMGTRRLKKRGTYPETVKLRFTEGTCEINTKTGVMRMWRHATPENVRTEVTGGTDYDLRFIFLMQDFAASVKRGEEGYLNPVDILANTEAAVALATTGHYNL